MLRLRPTAVSGSDLACPSALDVGERRNPEGTVGNGRGDEQPAGSLVEIAPPSCGHDMLRVHDTGSRGCLHLTLLLGACDRPWQTTSTSRRLTSPALELWGEVRVEPRS